MILGVYWYFKFPENLYQFKFFKFFGGYGGHADNGAELGTRVQVDNVEGFIQKLEDLKVQFPRTYLFISVNDHQLVIATGDRQLFDYHFQLAAGIEELLLQENAVRLDDKIPFKTKFSKNYHPEKEKFETIEHRFIQMVGSDFKQNNAENFSIRIDCNLPLVYKKDFINDLIPICNEENLHVFYYNDYDFNSQCNLMLFFTNGRQYKNHIQSVNINSFGSKVRDLSQKYPLHFGHFGGMKYYPLNGPHIELMIDENHILHKK
ncbi:MAG: hypothetical protein MUW56_04490 [Chryseobacterium sp.]|uniref:hypothetical protein n=1 Tax=Chryseobacterium sp. TaxID=1871047 RepID=UPI0025B9CE0A|nr:hypothetical protein [Chryseobacterium sp.]MCJ7932894.1 hypothetical protein [Chryseobacterium sp.]